VDTVVAKPWFCFTFNVQVCLKITLSVKPRRRSTFILHSYIPTYVHRYLNSRAAIFKSLSLKIVTSAGNAAAQNTNSKMATAMLPLTTWISPLGWPNLPATKLYPRPCPPDVATHTGSHLSQCPLNKEETPFLCDPPCMQLCKTHHHKWDH